MPVGMLSTHTIGAETRSRPMLVHDVDEGGWLWFLTDRSSRKACNLIKNPHATVVFQSAKGNKCVSVQGTAIVIRDDVRLKSLWNSSYRSWFSRGRKDPELALVAVYVSRAEYWLVPRGRIARLCEAARATVTRKCRESGSHGVIELRPFAA